MVEGAQLPDEERITTLTVGLIHIIVAAKDAEKGAIFLSEDLASRDCIRPMNW